MPSIGIAIVLFGAGVLGGALNSVAGGGSFIAFPTMLFAGVPPVAANATTAVALWPAGLTMIVLATMSALGGGFGAKLLLVTSDETFAKLVPFLLLAASVVFTFGPRLSQGKKREVPLAVGACVQFVIASYGGYFGGGMGILMLATMTLMGMDHIHRMNALKVVLGLLINGVALVFFLASGKVDLAIALPTTIGALFGGWFGADIARRIDPKKVRVGVLVFAWCLTTFFFLRRYA